MTRMRFGFTGALVIGLTLALAGLAAALPQPRASGSVEYGGVWVQPDGTVSFSFTAAGTPSAATGRVQYQRSATGFEAKSAGSVTCYLQVGRQGYLSGTLDKPFLSGPTEIAYWYATVVDGGATDADRAIVFLAADPVPCNGAGTMAFLDSEVTNTTVTRAQVQVIGGS